MVKQQITEDIKAALDTEKHSPHPKCELIVCRRNIFNKIKKFYNRADYPFTSHSIVHEVQTLGQFAPKEFKGEKISVHDFITVSFTV